jgi:hypothetical protein
LHSHDKGIEHKNADGHRQHDGKHLHGRHDDADFHSDTPVFFILAAICHT